MKRRTFLKSLSATLTTAAMSSLRGFASLPKMKITRVRAYLPPNPNPLFNQSDMVITVETDAGVMGIGEGGSKDLLSQAAGRLIGRDPQYIERLWQDMNLLSGWARENSCDRSTGPSIMGHQGKGTELTCT